MQLGHKLEVAPYSRSARLSNGKILQLRPASEGDPSH